MKRNFAAGEIPALLDGLACAADLELYGPNDVPISGVSIDSRTAGDGVLFVALPGENAHGAAFAKGALEAGCRAVLTDRAGHEILSQALEASLGSIAVFVSESPRELAAYVADLVYGKPSALFPVVGVTGTNGKTSVTTMCAQTLRALGSPAGIMGTNGTFLTWPDGREERIPTERTTPEAPDLHRLLAHMHSEGMDVAALEVSSHAMVLHRADAVRFRVAAFTNLSQDHLDFHKDMQEYFEAKASLFEPEHASVGVVCVDDEWGQKLAERAGIDCVTYSTRGADADFIAENLDSRGFETDFDVRTRSGETFRLTSALPGRHYVANTLAVQLIMEQLGYEREKVAKALAHSGTVPGRMERVRVADAGPRTIVDYSHTPDALEQALTTLGELRGSGRIITVMGAGGKRDTTKRPLMGEVAARLSDVVFVTDDNPRGDDPAAIRAGILAGIAEDSACDVHEMGDRAEAIAAAIAGAGPEDLVLIAGKGSERGQDLGHTVIDFDDREHARTALQSWEGAVNTEGDADASSKRA